MKGLDEILRQAQQMQGKVMEMQEELGKRLVVGTAGGGMVKVTATGRQEVTAVEIDKACVDSEDVDMLQDLVLAAINDALRQSRGLAEQEMAAAAGGFKLPDGFKLPGV